MSTAKIERYKGDTYAETMTITDGGSPMDITGATITLYTSNSKTISGTIVSGAEGTVSFTPLATDVDTAGTFEYEVEVITLGGVESTHAYGVWKILETIST